MQQTITINKTKYEIKFGFKANRILARMWDLNHMGKIGEKLAADLNFKDNQEPTIDQLSILGDLILSGVLSLQPNAEIDSDDVVDALFKDMNVIGGIIELYTSSLPNIDQKNMKGGNAVRGKKKGK